MEVDRHSADQFDVHHPGLDTPFRFSCSGELDTVGATVRQLGLSAYEPPVSDVLIELLRINRGLVLDVGANTGLYALAAAAVDPSIEVIAFEPLEPVRALLERNIALNPALAPRIAVEAVGLSSETGSFSFYETINDRGFISTSSSLESKHVQAVGGDFVEREIHTVTLDGFVRTLQGRRVSVMKIDVEGHEHAVLAGGRWFLARHRPILTIELLDHAERRPIDDLLVQDDYLAFAIAPGVLRHRERMMFFPDAWNHLLVPKEKAHQIVALCRTLDLRLELS